MTALHPSALALDLLALGQPRPGVVEHVESCDTCRAQVAASSPTSGPVPAWVPRRPPRPGWWLWSGLAVAAAASLVVVLRPGGAEEAGSETRAKGSPSFAVHVEHRGEVRLWDGRSTVSAGDRLQLKVASAGYRHLVLGVQERGAWSTAFEGPVSPSGETVLPRSFRLEPDSTTLQLGLLFCDRPCSGSELQVAAAQARRDPKRWWSSFVITRKDAP